MKDYQVYVDYMLEDQEGEDGGIDVKTFAVGAEDAGEAYELATQLAEKKLKEDPYYGKYSEIYVWEVTEDDEIK